MRDFALVLATVGRTLELNRLFDTLAAQSYRDFEVIVVDQNQDDRLLPILHRARYLGLVLRHLRHSPPNLALARNAGIAAADARWIGFPDDDCWYQPQTLARIALRSRRFDHPHGIVTRWVEQDPAHPPATLSWARSSRFRDLPVSSITLFFQRDLLERIGGCEETDLVLRALRAGARVVYEPGAQIHHRVDTAHSGRSWMRRTATSRARGTGAMYAKHRLPLWVIARGLVSPIIKPLSRGHLGAELAHGLAIAQGRWQGWLHWWSQHGADQTTSLPDSMMLRG